MPPHILSSSHPLLSTNLKRKYFFHDDNNNDPEQHSDFINSLDDESLRNLENAMEDEERDVENNKSRGHYGESSVKSERERKDLQD